MRRQNSLDEVSTIKREIMTDLFFDFLILVLVVHFGRNAHCGIPIFRWCMVYFFFLALRSLSNFAKILLVRSNFSQGVKTTL